MKNNISPTGGNVLSLAGTKAAGPLGYLSWTFGQGGRDPYYIMVVIYIFFPYFSNTVVGDPVQGQSLIGYMNAIAGFALALTAPFLGAIADKNGKRKPWVASTVMIMVVGACLLWYVLPNDKGLSINATLALLLIISIAFAISEVFHNAMLPSIAPTNKVGLISGLAFSLGNVGGLLLMVFVLFAFSMPGTIDWSFLPAEPLFGIDQSLNEHDRIVGPIAGVWMLVFTLPLLLFTPDGKSSGIPVLKAARQGIEDVITTVKQLKHYSNIGIYLLSRMFFIDGMVGVMTFGGVYASGTFGWDTTTLLIFGLFTSLSAMIGAFVGGKLDDHIGSLSTLKVSIIAASVILLVLVSIQPGTLLYVIPVSQQATWSFPYFQTPAEQFYFVTNQVFAMFFVTGLSSSRTLMARISPPEMATQFFGLFALSGTVTAFLAPLLVATTTAWFQSQRAGFASLASLMIIGAVMLLFVKEEQAKVAPGNV
ncbi:MAG: MFS transporter [Gammaproteobacteria bacterium]|jgi:MFS transporter, UMF1 family|nr:MFS transporter [Gammaproteobacteria bacterium]MBT5204042.1 MFS transporter [Gammaproteobacteria bacterium]MBT5601085.1 MFS transporter [Gammaproteobacteria bacterium]MBT6245035.1 MFS transporter [Gammaproteobacteria bacterium]